MDQNKSGVIIDQSKFNQSNVSINQMNQEGVSTVLCCKTTYFLIKLTHGKYCRSAIYLKVTSRGVLIFNIEYHAQVLSITMAIT